jgi:rod shape-determining protein MreD
VTGRRALVLAALVLLAVVLQSAVVARLPLPGSPPDLVLVLVVAVGLRAGPRAGMLTGFAAGLLADLSGDAELGRLALAYVVAGGLAGLLEDDVEGSLVLAALVGAVAAAVAVLVYAGHGVLLGDPRVTGGALGRAMASTVPYCAALTPAIVPPVGALLRRVARRR